MRTPRTVTQCQSAVNLSHAVFHSRLKTYLSPSLSSGESFSLSFGLISSHIVTACVLKIFVNRNVIEVRRQIKSAYLSFGCTIIYPIIHTYLLAYLINEYNCNNNSDVLLNKYALNSLDVENSG